MTVQRSDILDYVTYEDQRDEIRSRAMATKRLRRINADCLTFLFENRETIRYQVLEMLRIEKIVREADIVHELTTYNELLGTEGALGCTLLIGLDDPAVRDQKLTAWLNLLNHLYLLLEDGTKVRPTYDPRQVGETRLSSVQYLKFPVAGQVPVACGSDHPDLTVQTPLSAEQHQALTDDLRDA